MTHDLGRPAARVRRFLGRESRAAVVTPDEDTKDLGTKREWELAKQVYAAEMLLNRALIAVDEMLPNAVDPQHVDDLLDLQNLLTGKATKS